MSNNSSKTLHKTSWSDADAKRVLNAMTPVEREEYKFLASEKPELQKVDRMNEILNLAIGRLNLS